MFKDIVIPDYVSSRLLATVVSKRYKLNQRKDLRTLQAVIVWNLSSGVTLQESLWNHWQVWWKADVLCDIWPTVLKFRFPHGAGAIGKDTVQATNVRSFLTSLSSAIAEQCTLQADREVDCKRRAEAERQRQLAEDPALPALPDDGKLPVLEPMPSPVARPAATPQQQRPPCNGRLELVLDGEELRVIIAEGTYCSSLRLNCADTRAFLAAAAACQAQLDEPKPATDS